MKTQTKVSEVLAKVAEWVNPKEAERLRLDSIVKTISQNLDESFAGQSVKPEIMLGGSFAKGTWLSGSGDIDFFLLYPIDYSREKLESEAIERARQAVRDYEINMRFAEHPYVEAFVDNARVNLVPCYKVEKGEWQSAVDRSPFHTEYVRRLFNEKLRLETRILKSFVKGTGVYGAEVKTQGFSGYVCEVLILKFGSFEEVVKHFSMLKKGEIISVEPFDQALAASFTSPLIILDPVDTARNLGSAISTLNLSKFVLQSRRFLDRPSISFFERPKAKSSSRQNRELLQRTVILRFKIKSRSVDVLWGQLYKSLEALSNKMELWGFKVLRKKASTNEKDECALIFLLHETRISKFHIRVGPDVFRSEDFPKFVGKNQEKAVLSWLDSEGRAVSLFEREKKSIDIFEHLKKTLQSSQELLSMGFSKGIAEEISFAKIVPVERVIASKSKKDDWIRNDVLSIVRTEDELKHATA